MYGTKVRIYPSNDNNKYILVMKIMAKALRQIIIAIMLTALLVCTAESTDGLFLTAKEAAYLLYNKEYAAVVKKLNIDEAVLKDVKNCKELGEYEPQTDVAVYWTGETGAYIAIPLENPINESVKTLVFSIDESNAFIAVYVDKWVNVQKEYGSSSDVVWNGEINLDFIIIGDW